MSRPSDPHTVPISSLSLGLCRWFRVLGCRACRVQDYVAEEWKAWQVFVVQGLFGLQGICFTHVCVSRFI